MLVNLNIPPMSTHIIGTLHMILLFGFLLDSPFFQDLFELLKSRLELMFYFILATNNIFNPWVHSYFFNFGSLIGIVSNHSDKQIPKRLIKEICWSSSWVCFPKGRIVLVFDQFIVRIINSCLFKWRIASIHDEQDYPCCKNINFSSLVIFSRNFWCHIPFSSKFGM